MIAKYVVCDFCNESIPEGGSGVIKGITLYQYDSSRTRDRGWHFHDWDCCARYAADYLGVDLRGRSEHETDREIAVERDAD